MTIDQNPQGLCATQARIPTRGDVDDEVETGIGGPWRTTMFLICVFELSDERAANLPPPRVRQQTSVCTQSKRETCLLHWMNCLILITTVVVLFHTSLWCDWIYVTQDCYTHGAPPPIGHCSLMLLPLRTAIELGNVGISVHQISEEGDSKVCPMGLDILVGYWDVLDLIYKHSLLFTIADVWFLVSWSVLSPMGCYGAPTLKPTQLFGNASPPQVLNEHW